MSTLKFVCPLPAALTTIPDVTCPEKFGQIQRMALRQTPPGTDPTFATMADVIDQAKWTTAIAASDVTKIVITPFMASFVLPVGAPVVEEGNNNNTVNGIELLEGLNNAAITARFLNLPTSIAKILRSFTTYSALTPGFTNLEAAFFTENNQIIVNSDSAGTVPAFFPIYNWLIPSVGSDGLNKPNVHPVMFTMLGNWDENLKVATPTWKPLQL